MATGGLHVPVAGRKIGAGLVAKCCALFGEAWLAEKKANEIQV